MRANCCVCKKKLTLFSIHKHYLSQKDESVISALAVLAQSPSLKKRG
ncbi:hypothetical protein CRENPOLYSF1_1450002 [Crenothrix polyspora]|uniref:Uncharacterized protein n=1 Tax=Crenothrix polyspora TaxID=360316 RepID=A0A1R4H306_9GAMM|nr:hypothetical protein CRENPOLYSF1_1450002 [Crenothrix polyspora]